MASRNRNKSPHSLLQERIRITPAGKQKKTWQGIVTYYDPQTGRRRQTARTFSLKEEAETWARATEAEFRSDPLVRTRGQDTFAQFMELWLEIIDQSDRSPTTLADYHLHARTACRPSGSKISRLWTFRGSTRPWPGRV